MMLGLSASEDNDCNCNGNKTVGQVCGGAGLRLMTGVGLFAGVRLVGGRSLRVEGFLFLEPAIKRGLHRCLSLFVEEVLVARNLVQDPTPLNSRPFEIWVISSM